VKQADSVENSFILRLNKIVLENISNENFGVESLAEEAGMNRTSLYRRVKFLTGQSVSEFIREVRLQKAHELLLDDLITASEVAYRVGFSSPSYFSTCFSNYFGYSPRETRKRQSTIIPDNSESEASVRPVSIQRNLSVGRATILAGIPALIILLIFLIVTLTTDEDRNSIVVLPFKNLGAEKEAEYFADAVVDGILNQLSIIEELSVRSRTTSDYIGKKDMPLKKISQTVKARYILEGSVQKTGDRIRITVQFIDGKKDAHIWSENFDCQYANILGAQSDIALMVADK